MDGGVIGGVTILYARNYPTDSHTFLPVERDKDCFKGIAHILLHRDECIQTHKNIRSIHFSRFKIFSNIVSL